MKSPHFLEHKVKRILDEHGKSYTFTLSEIDQYNQPTEGSVKISVIGLYHEQNSFISLSNSDAASVQRKKSPMILTLLDEQVKLLKQGDSVVINSTKYKISGILDIQNYGVIADISLEMEV